VSMYYSPEIVRLLITERLEEARAARRVSHRKTSSTTSLRARMTAAVRRVTGLRSTPAACSCS
jgi:hypothetical protein